MRSAGGAFLSLATVKTRLSAAQAKLAVRNGAEVAVLAGGPELLRA